MFDFLSPIAYYAYYRSHFEPICQFRIMAVVTILITESAQQPIDGIPQRPPLTLLMSRGVDGDAFQQFGEDDYILSPRHGN